MQQSVQEFDQDFYCPICTQLSLNAVQSLCCKKIFCQKCAQSVQKNKLINSCPLCRAQEFQFSPAKIRQKINNLKKKCKYCKTEYHFFKLKKHQKECLKAPIKCIDCKNMFIKQDIVKHTLKQHQQSIIKIIELMHQDSFHIPYKDLQVQNLVNQNGRKVILGTTGKFYCKGKLQGHCFCCNGNCGPTNGQNCLECMKLDIKRRGLRKGFLVNARGSVCWNENDSFRCQKMLDDKNGFCTDGSICIYCKNITKTAINRYFSLL